jgi:hypothetical protein
MARDSHAQDRSNAVGVNRKRLRDERRDVTAAGENTNARDDPVAPHKPKRKRGDGGIDESRKRKRGADDTVTRERKRKRAHAEKPDILRPSAQHDARQAPLLCPEAVLRDISRRIPAEQPRSGAQSIPLGNSGPADMPNASEMNDAADGAGRRGCGHDDPVEPDDDDGGDTLNRSKRARRTLQTPVIRSYEYIQPKEGEVQNKAWATKELQALHRRDDLGTHKHQYLPWRMHSDSTVWYTTVVCPFARRRGFNCPWRARLEVHGEKRDKTQKEMGTWMLAEGDAGHCDHSSKQRASEVSLKRVCTPASQQASHSAVRRQCKASITLYIHSAHSPEP